MSKSTGQPYYWHSATKTTQWNKPSLLSDSSTSSAKKSKPNGVRASHLLIKHKQSRKPSSWKEVSFVLKLTFVTFTKTKPKIILKHSQILQEQKKKRKQFYRNISMSCAQRRRKICARNFSRWRRDTRIARRRKKAAIWDFFDRVKCNLHLNKQRILFFQLFFFKKKYILFHHRLFFFIGLH
jgi:hypothetical protein